MRYAALGWFHLVALAATVAVFGRAPAAVAANGQLELTVIDRETGKAIPARIHLKNAAGKPVQVQNKAPFYHDHYVFQDKIILSLPKGNYTFEIERGPEYLWRSGQFTMSDNAADERVVDLKRFANLADEGWYAGDLDVRRPADQLPLLMRAEDLYVVPLTTWWNGKSELAKPPEADKRLVNFDGGRFYQLQGGGDSRLGGTLFYFNAPPPEWKNVSPEFPPAVQFAKQVKEAGGWIDAQRPFDWDLPVWIANGVLNSVEVHNRHQCRDGVIDNEQGGKARDAKQFSGILGNGQWSQEIYYNLLNCGIHLPPSAGSGTGVAPNPLGYNRVYVHVDGPLTYEKWWEGLRAGRVVATNGPLLRPVVEGQFPGHAFHFSPDETVELEIGLTLSVRSPDTISYLEVVKNGRVAGSYRLDEWNEMGRRLPKLKFTESGWFLIRAVCDNAKTYRHAMTGPYYVQIGDRQRISKAAAQFFLDWVVERARQIKLDDPDQRRTVIDAHRVARDFFQNLVTRANAE